MRKTKKHRNGSRDGNLAADMVKGAIGGGQSACG